MEKYNETKQYWDNIFSEIPDYSPKVEIKIPEIEEALEWLVKNNKSVIDFGCGNGKVLGRCLERGIEFVHGIDICESGIEKAKNIMKESGYEKKSGFTVGGIENLDLFMPDAIDSAILFNILDNITPDDSMRVISKMNMIVKKDGKILIKLNPYIEKQQREKENFEELEEEFYKEESGLYLWNLNDEQFEEVIKPYFEIEKKLTIEFKEYSTTNRMYYLRNK